MAFVGLFLKYVIILVLLVVVAILGVFAGKKLRDNKDAKNALLEDGVSAMKKEEK